MKKLFTLTIALLCACVLYAQPKPPNPTPPKKTFKVFILSTPDSTHFLKIIQSMQMLKDNIIYIPKEKMSADAKIANMAVLDDELNWLHANIQVLDTTNTKPLPLDKKEPTKKGDKP